MNETQQLKFVNQQEHIQIVGNKLPHWNQTSCVQFVTFRLADSLPQVKLQELKEDKEKWLKQHPSPWDDATKQEYDETFTRRLDQWIDAGYGDCQLADVSYRALLFNAMLHFDGDRYDMHAFVIMPNHVHALLTPREEGGVQSIIGSWKRFSAREFNKVNGKEGNVWERESFDHMVRNMEEYRKKLYYIIQNPRNLEPGTFSLYVK